VFVRGEEKGKQYVEERYRMAEQKGRGGDREVCGNFEIVDTGMARGSHNKNSI
jgi:hypothetical protein